MSSSTLRKIASARPFQTAPHTIEYDFIDQREHRKRMFIEDVPHIIQYGWHLEDEEDSRIGLWRCGKKFDIIVNGANIRGTKFYKIWRPLIKNNWDGKKLKGDALRAYRHAWRDRRAQVFDLVIHPCLPLIQSIAPVQPHWITLQDFLHCPAYDLQLIADPETGEPKVEQTTTKVHDTAVYDYHPKPKMSVGEIPSDLPQYVLQDIFVDEYTAGIRFFITTRKVRLHDGTICYFLSGLLADMPNSRDPSMNTIRAFLKLHQAAQRGCVYPPALPKVVGIVLDKAAASVDNHMQEPDVLIAGLLLSWLDTPKRLSDIKDTPAEQMGRWRRRVLDTVSAMHSHGISPVTDDDWGDFEEDGLWNYTRGYKILIDAQEEVWMDVVDPMFVEEPLDGKSFAKAVKMDLDKVEKAFPGFGEKDTTHARL